MGRRTGRAGVGCGWPRHRLVEKGFAVFSTLHRGLCFSRFPDGAGAALPPRHPRSSRTNKAPFGGGACLARARSLGVATRPPARTPIPYRREAQGGCTWVGRAAPGSRAGARAGGGGARLRAPGRSARRRGYGRRCCPLSSRLAGARNPAPREPRRKGGGRWARLVHIHPAAAAAGGAPAWRGLVARWHPLCSRREWTRALPASALTPRPPGRLLLSSCAPVSRASAPRIPCAHCTRVGEDLGSFSEHHWRFGPLTCKWFEPRAGLFP